MGSDVMGDFDPREYLLLVQNPRISYRDLASKLGVSTPVEYKRMQQKCGSGALFTFSVISTSYLNATMVTVFGNTGTKRPIEDIIDDLRKNDCVCYATFCSANMILVTGLLRHTADMEHFLKFVSETCQMGEPTLAIESLGRVGDPLPFRQVSSEVKLSDLDLRIISSLHLDGRKSYGKISEEVGASTRTVQKHLERMIEEGSIEIWVLGDPAAIRYVTTAVHVHTKKGVNGNALGMEIIRRYPNEVYAFRRYCNLPNLISMSACHETMSGLNKLLDELAVDDRICNVVPNVVVRGALFDTWREKMLPKLRERALTNPTN
jgi:DNA-binding Lrp family transcriptional regulator